MTPTPGDITFWVAGLPAPGGSKTAVPLRAPDGSLRLRADGNPAIVYADASRRNRPWRKLVAKAGLVAFPKSRGPLEGPLAVAFTFTLPRPKSHYRTGKFAAQLRPDAPAYPTGPPDTTKLIRSTEDALIGICWIDDSQIVTQAAAKRYGPRPGCQVVVRRLAPGTKGIAT